MQALRDCHTLPRGGGSSQESGLGAGLQVLSDRTPTWPTPQGRGFIGTADPSRGLSGCSGWIRQQCSVTGMDGLGPLRLGGADNPQGPQQEPPR